MKNVILKESATDLSNRHFQLYAMKSVNLKTGLPAILVAICEDEKVIGSVNFTVSILVADKKSWDEFADVALSLFLKRGWAERILANSVQDHPFDDLISAHDIR